MAHAGRGLFREILLPQRLGVVLYKRLGFPSGFDSVLEPFVLAEIDVLFLVSDHGDPPAALPAHTGKAAGVVALKLIRKHSLEARILHIAVRFHHRLAALTAAACIPSVRQLVRRGDYLFAAVTHAAPKPAAIRRGLTRRFHDRESAEPRAAQLGGTALAKAQLPMPSAAAKTIDRGYVGEYRPGRMGRFHLVPPSLKRLICQRIRQCRKLLSLPPKTFSRDAFRPAPVDICRYQLLLHAPPLQAKAIQNQNSV